MTGDLDWRVATLRRRVRVALEREPADLVLRRCRVISVHSEEVYPADVIVSAGRIVGVRERFDGRAAQELDCEGLFAAPGLIEPYLSWAGPVDALAELSRALVARGTTTAFVARTGGAPPGDARSWQECARVRPGRIFLLDPSNGRSPLAGGGCDTLDEVLARLRQGSTVLLDVRAGWDALAEMLRGVIARQLDTRHLCFSAGHADHTGLLREQAASLAGAVRLAIRLGIAPMRAVQMASLNAATCHGLDDHVGSITPARSADILLVRDLADFEPEVVIADGAIVATSRA